MIDYVLSLSKLETVLVQTVRRCLNDKPQTPWVSDIWNAGHLSLKLLLSESENISSSKWFHDLFFFNEDSNFSSVVFHSQPQFEERLDKKRSVKQNKFLFHKTNIFSLNVSFYILLNQTHSSGLKIKQKNY